MLQTSRRWWQLCSAMPFTLVVVYRQHQWSYAVLGQVE
jgi:hypothetical protein